MEAQISQVLRAAITEPYGLFSEGLAPFDRLGTDMSELAGGSSLGLEQMGSRE